VWLLWGVGNTHQNKASCYWATYIAVKDIYSRGGTVAEKESEIVGIDDERLDTVVAEVVAVEDSFVKQVRAESVVMTESGAGLITVEGPTEMSQAGAGVIVADGGAKMFQSGSGVIVANSVTAEESFVGVLVAGEAAFSDDSRVLISGLNAVILGAVAGIVFGLVAALADYGIRGHYRD